MEADIQRQIQLFTLSNSLPKIDIHAHLNGSIRKKTLLENLSISDKNELEKLLSKMDFPNAMKFFKISSKIIRGLSIVRRITQEMIEDWNKHNVIYLEIRTSLKEKAEIFTKEEYLKAVLEEINNFNNEKKMITRLIISLDREKELNDYEETYNIYQNLNDENLKKLIVGIDYSGNEINEKHKYEELIPYLEKFRNEGLKITIHMGENPNYQIFPFDKFIPDRVSHCYFLKEEHYLEILKRNIHIEVCPTCSYKITHQTDFSKIPLRNFWNKKIVDINGNEMIFKNISINTDDTMLILSDVSQEYYEVSVNFKWDVNDVKNILLNTIDHIFEKDNDIKNQLREKVNNFFE